MDNLEQDIIDYIELGKLVTDIEAQFSRITIGDLHQSSTFGEISFWNFE